MNKEREWETGNMLFCGKWSTLFFLLKASYISSDHHHMECKPKNIFFFRTFYGLSFWSSISTCEGLSPLPRPPPPSDAEGCLLLLQAPYDFLAYLICPCVIEPLPLQENIKGLDRMTNKTILVCCLQCLLGVRIFILFNVILHLPF